MTDKEYSAYIRKLRASISPERLRSVRAQQRKRAHVKLGKTLAKTLLTLGGVSAGIAGVVAIARSTKQRPLLAKR